MESGVIPSKDEWPRAGNRRAGTWWIDELGRWNRIDPHSPLVHERCELPDNTVYNELMYRFYGMLRIKAAEDAVQISWDVGYVQEGALDEAVAFLHGLPLRTAVSLRFFFGGWGEEIFIHSREAAERMEATRAFAKVAPLPGTSVRAQPLGDLAQRQDAFGLLLRAIRANGGVLSDELRRFLSTQRVLDDLVLFQPSQDHGQLVYSHVGANSPIADLYGREWCEQVLGLRYDIDPCVAGSTRSLWEPYEQVVRNETPRFDHVRTLVSIAQREDTWAPYERLLMPYRLPDREGCGLALLSRITPDIAIPFMGRRAA